MVLVTSSGCGCHLVLPLDVLGCCVRPWVAACCCVRVINVIFTCSGWTASVIIFREQAYITKLHISLEKETNYIIKYEGKLLFLGDVRILENGQEPERLS